MSRNSHVAKSVLSILSGTDLIAQSILDRKEPLSIPLLRTLVHLPQFGIAERRPRKRVDRKGNPRPTDMDLASLLVQLAKGQQTVLQLPTYETTLPRSVDPSVTHLSELRYGRLIALSSHREHLSFGVMVEDVSLVQRTTEEKDAIGAPRTFLIINHNGDWHAGWKGITWKPRVTESVFRERYDLVDDQNHQGYQYFVHPNRRQSIFSRAHFLAKLALMRLDDESKARKPQGDDTVGTVADRLPGKDEPRPTFTMQLRGLSLLGEYPAMKWSKEEAGQYWWYRRTLQFIVRANEFAWYQHGMHDGFIANWIRGFAWETLHKDKWQETGQLCLPFRITLSYRKDVVIKTVAAR